MNERVNERVWLLILATACFFVILLAVAFGLGILNILTPPIDDPLLPSLWALGFSDRRELLEFFKIQGATPTQIAACPDEFVCVQVVGKRGVNGLIQPFLVTNPTLVTFDGIRADGETGVPPGTWWVRVLIIRPW